MAKSTQISPGMTIEIGKKIYRVDSAVKVSVAKGVPFMKTKLRSLTGDEEIEKNFKLDQEVTEVTLSEKRLEYLYQDEKDYLFLDVDDLEETHVVAKVVGEKINFLKEGIQVKAVLYGDAVFSIELPQFLELMVMKVQPAPAKVASSGSGSGKVALLETGAKIEVPLFIETGDVIKVDTHLGEFVQRI